MFVDLCPVGALTNKDLDLKQEFGFTNHLKLFVMVVQKGVIGSTQILRKRNRKDDMTVDLDQEQIKQ